jgi:catabolite repression HPr-like protein
MKKNVMVQMSTEFEARPIAHLVQIANAYNSRIYLEMGTARVNAKSIMGVMGLALINGEHVMLDAEGEDETEAVAALEKFLSE